MPRPKKKNFYFGETEEYAVRMFLTATTVTERSLVYNKYLYAPLNKMIDSIIRRYKLYRKNETYDDLHADVLSFLITKSDKFKPEKNKKAYSYFGTICKNYLMIKDQKELNRLLSYEDMSTTIENRDDQIYYIDNDDRDNNKIFRILLRDIEMFMDENQLSENEEKLGLALVDIFNNYDEIFVHGEGNKFNKNLILLSLREMTNLTTKEIRTSLKRYKVIYEGIIDNID